MSNIKPVGYLKPFTRFCCTIGNLPSSYMQSLSYEEQLLWLCDYLQNTVIPTINENAGSVAELQELYTELKNYVDNYFNNLDVQTEINNKLDQMAESGQLQEIMADYLNIRAIFAFNNIEDMKNASNLKDGSFAKTYGSTKLNDGISYFYKIRTITNEDIIDNINLIPLSNDDTLIAERISSFLTNDKSNPIFYGADPLGITDSTLAINTCILNNKNNSINFSQGNYLISSSINLPFKINEKVNINGNGAKLIVNNELNSVFKVGFDKNTEPSNEAGFPCFINDLFIDSSNHLTTYAIDIVKGFKDFKLMNCTFYRTLNGIRIAETAGTPSDVYIDNCLFFGTGSEENGVGIIINGSDNNINNSRIYGFTKGFEINAFSYINTCQVLLRWKEQTVNNFDPYPRNSQEFNNYYFNTVFANVNSNVRISNSYCDSLYKFLDINTPLSIILNNCFYYNARQNVDCSIFNFFINNPQFILNDCNFNISKNENGIVINQNNLTFSNYSQFSLNNIHITNISNITNPADLILSSIPYYHSNLNMTANTWYILKIISNMSDYNNLLEKIFINGYEYTLRCVGRP